MKQPLDSQVIEYAVGEQRGPLFPRQMVHQVDRKMLEVAEPQHQQHFESSFMNGVALFKTHELNSLTVNLHENLDIFLQ